MGIEKALNIDVSYCFFKVSVNPEKLGVYEKPEALRSEPADACVEKLGSLPAPWHAIGYRHLGMYFRYVIGF
jgi:hypothetical protein